MITDIKIKNIAIKRGLEEKLLEWTDIPKAGEPVYAIDTGVLKIGNGVDVWKDLPALGAPEEIGQPWMEENLEMID